MLGVTSVAVIVALTVWALVASRTTSRPSSRPAPGRHGPGSVDAVPADSELDPNDVADLGARLGSVDAEAAATRDAVLLARLQPLVSRKVPVRAIEPVPQLRVVRVRFADGTAVVVRGETAGDAGLLASVLRDHAVLPGACSTDAAGTRLVFDWSGGRRHLAVRVAGLDQPD